jgi:small glutamine-rich tetratricopeptide repeat-containing protein alpha
MIFKWCVCVTSLGFKQKVTEKGFFRGTEPGEPEYKERYRKMVLRFKDKVKGQQQQQPSPGAAASANVPPPAPSSSAEAAAGTMSAAADEEAAEAFKNEGNVKLQAKDFDGAVASYTAAIQKSLDGPKSHIYFANRAAARQYLKQHKVGHKPNS